MDSTDNFGGFVGHYANLTYLSGVTPESSFWEGEVNQGKGNRDNTIVVSLCEGKIN